MKFFFLGLGMAAALLALPGSSRAATLRAANVAEVVAAVNRAQPGDEIVLAPGQYQDLTLTITGQGQQGLRRLRAETPGQAILTGAPKLEIKGDFIEIADLVFQDCVLPAGSRGAVIFDGAGFSRLANCTFDNNQLPAGIALVGLRNAAHDNQVTSNRFVRTRYKSIQVVVDDNARKLGPPLHNRIDHNLFQDVPPYKKNGAETIQIGQRAIPFSDLRPETIIEDNEFVRCNGEAEIISVKTSGNIIRNNLFRENKGEVVMRHGHDNTVTGNRFEGGSGGIRVSGHGHVLLFNTINGCSSTGIRLYYGTPDVAHPASYLPVYDCTIRSNTIVNCAKAGILVGDNKNAHYQDEKWAKPPYSAKAVMDCTVAPYNNRIDHNTITGKEGALIQTADAPKNIIENNVLNTR